MKTEDFNYNLPKKLIAQTPENPRDSSRLLVLNKENGQIKHQTFYDIIDYLKPGDVLVMNDSKVFPARLIGEKTMTHGKLEILLNHEIEPGLWECVGKNLKIGNHIKFLDSKLSAVVVEKDSDVYRVRFNMIDDLFDEIEKIGLTPLPPYIKRNKIPLDSTRDRQETRHKEDDKEKYQTVFAKERGSVAVPTAGLHFTKELMNKIRYKDVDIEYLTLHVGLGTFAPVKSNQIEKHKIHKEFFSIDKKVIEKVIQAKREHRRIIAVGTTAVRTLETVFNKIQNPNIKFQINSKSQIPKSEKLTSYNLTPKAYSGWTNIFIYPGYKFKCVDGMVTNFHLPKSSLLMLVSAFAGKENIDHAYIEAIKQKYRFYSYGDAMLIV